MKLKPHNLQIPRGKYLPKLPNINEKYTKLATSVILTLLALSLFGVFAIGPTISTITELQRQLDDAKEVTRKLKQKATNLYTLQEKYQTLQPELPIILGALPKSPETTLLLAQLQSAATTANLSIRTLHVFEVELAPGKFLGGKLPSYVYTIELVGNYPNMLKFLSTISHFDRIITIDAMTINKAGDNVSQEQLQLSVRGKAFFKD